MQTKQEFSLIEVTPQNANEHLIEFGRFYNSGVLILLTKKKKKIKDTADLL